MKRDTSHLFMSLMFMYVVVAAVVIVVVVVVVPPILVALQATVAEI